MSTQESIDNHPSRPGPPSFLKDLNDQQRKAVTTIDGPLLIVAGAGSGKTRVLTYRIAYLLQQKRANPGEILALTFTNKAAREMQQRITRLIDHRASGLWMGTFHSIFAKILRIECEKIGFSSNFTIYDTGDSEQMIKLILGELGYDPKEIRPRTLQRKISDAKNELVNPDTYKEKFISGTLDEITSRVYAVYQNRLKEANAMDFDDLLVRPIELFETWPEVLHSWQQKFRYILIDEYQDTNHAQYKVTNLLAGEHQNICVVGDDAQSIYSFRGADIRNILDFKNDYEDAVEIPLEQNYRSTRYILQVADSVIKNNERQLQKTLWTENREGEVITLLENLNERDEANRVANYIENLKLRNGYDLNDFAILYRTNYQSRVFEEILRRKQIPYQLVGGLSFYQRQEVKDVLAYLTLLVNPHDEQNLLRIINKPSRGIGKKTLSDLIAKARSEGKTIWSMIEEVDRLDLYKPAKARIREFVEMIHSLRMELDKGGSILEVTRTMLEATGYIKALIEDRDPKSLSRRENILELQNAISFYEKNTRNPTLGAFLQEISLITDADKYDESKPAVTLMTIHGSKGLEFPVVFIVGLEENLFPVGGRENDEVDIEEERRLFYVAITRAQEELFFSFSKMRYKFGEETRQMRSRFLNEVDPGVVRTETGATITQTGSFSGRPQSGMSRSGREAADSGNSSSSTRVEYDWKKPKSGYRKKQSGNSSVTIEYDLDEGNDPFHPGVQVEHPKFGRGKIISRSGEGSDSRVVVFFKNRGQKTLMLRVAGLHVTES